MAKDLPPHSAEANVKAQAEAQALLEASRYAAIAYLEPNSTQPAIGRIAIAMINHQLITFISDLSAHTMGIKAHTECALMLGEIGKGDGLASPRLSLTAQAAHIDKKQREMLMPSFLKQHPKAKLYASFGDFNFYFFEISRASYYGGFGRAHQFAGPELFAQP